MKNIAALMEAVGQLHPRGAPDAELISVLASLLGVAPVADLGRSRNAGDNAAGLFPGIRPSPRSAASRRASDPGSPTIDLPAQSELPVREARPATGDEPLQARPATLLKVAERADLAPSDSSAIPATNHRQAGAGDVDVSPAPVASLFAPNRVRAILRGLATVPIPSGEPEMRGVVDLIARAVPVTRFPERSVYALGHAVQLLFDAGPAMLPFTRDKQQLAAAAVRLIGKDRVRVADFLGAPLQGVRIQRSVRWQPFAWPDRRSTVVVISDLGIGSSADNQDMGPAWRDFLDQAARKQVCIVVLIPYPASRWPRGVEGFGAALTWDLATGVQSLRRALRLRR